MKKTNLSLLIAAIAILSIGSLVFSGCDNGTTSTVTPKPATYSISFSAKAYETDLTTEVASPGNFGSISATQGGGGIISGTKLAAGTSVVLTANLLDSAGYQFIGFQADGIDSTGADNPWTLTMPKNNVTVTAVFEQIPPHQYLLTVTPKLVDSDGTTDISSTVPDNSFGSISASRSGIGLTPPYNLTEGTNVILTASPGAGYQFLRFEDDSGIVISDNNPYTIAMSASDTTVIAVFEAIPPDSNTLTYSVKAVDQDGNDITSSASDFGSISGTSLSGNSVIVDTSVTLTAAPGTDTSFQFLDFEDGSGTVLSSDNPYTFSMPDNELTVVAVFQQQPGPVVPIHQWPIAQNPGPALGDIMDPNTPIEVDSNTNWFEKNDLWGSDVLELGWVDGPSYAGAGPGCWVSNWTPVNLNSITMSLWAMPQYLNTADYPSDRSLQTVIALGSDGLYTLAFTPDGQIALCDGAAEASFGSIDIATYNNQWMHIALTVGDGNAILYINGAKFGEIDNSITVSGTTYDLTAPVSIDQIIIGGDKGVDRFNAYVTDLRLYDTVLGASDVAAIVAEAPQAVLDSIVQP